MPRKGMRSLLFFHSSPHHRSSSSSSAAATSTASPRHTYSATMMEDNISSAQEIITKWDPEGSAFAKVTSLFYESRDEARLFLRVVADLQRAMQSFMADSPVSSSDLLVRAQSLMQAAMRRLQKEFYQILSANRDRLDPESVPASTRSSLSLTSISSLSDLEEDDLRDATESIGEVERVSALAMADLRSIAECMISCGYAKECVKTYKLIRRSIVDEGLYKLGFEKQSPSQLQKLDWDVLDIRVRAWLAASRVAVRTLFTGERALCDHVFASSDTIRDSCFADISRDPAVSFFAFPEQVTSKTKRSPEKVFRLLDMYGSISELWPEIESVFSSESTSTVRSQAVSSLLKLGEAVRSSIAEFDSAIQKDNSKVAAPGGGLHPLTRYVMNYVAFLADYAGVLADIFADHPLPVPLLPESFFDASPTSTWASTSRDEEINNPMSPISARLAWLILVLLCKLDSKAELYREVSVAYLFLANNLQYVVNKVRGSKLLELLGGDEWASKHEAKASGYAASYERLAWGKVLAAVPQDVEAVTAMDSPAAKEQMRRFNEAFEEAYRGQAGWVVPDGKMRDELKLSIARKLIPPYRSLYERCRFLLREERNSIAVVRFAPEDLGNYLSDLFYGDGNAGSTVSSVSVSSAAGSSSKASSRSL
uniref:Exocyst subunit Exo70 family protein n=1 Tax=Anthurium amnicola TaxID=1678845 RepID=A0A1D1ZH80_9ARAE